MSKKRKKEKGFPVPSLSPVLSSLLSSPSPPTRTHRRHSKALLANSTITSLFDTDHHKHSSFNFSDQLTRIENHMPVLHRLHFSSCSKREQGCDRERRRVHRCGLQNKERRLDEEDELCR
ncbi:unnamed protein product [Camellia sinensis]